MIYIVPLVLVYEEMKGRMRPLSGDYLSSISHCHFYTNTGSTIQIYGKVPSYTFIALIKSQDFSTSFAGDLINQIVPTPNFQIRRTHYSSRNTNESL